MRQYGYDMRLLRSRRFRFNLRWRIRPFDVCAFLEELGIPCDPRSAEAPVLDPDFRIRRLPPLPPGEPAPEGALASGTPGQIDCLTRLCSQGWVAQDGLAIIQFAAAGAPIPQSPGALSFWTTRTGPITWSLTQFRGEADGGLSARQGGCLGGDDFPAVVEEWNRLAATDPASLPGGCG